MKINRVLQGFILCSLLGLTSVFGHQLPSCEHKPDDLMIKNTSHGTIIDHYKRSHGYMTYLPPVQNGTAVSSRLVILSHGYGALNPRIFGAWIKHLLKKGNVVVYPRYQRNLVFPSSSKFTSNVARAIKDAISELQSAGNLTEDFKMVLVGHSFGGVISANLLLDYEHYQIPKPAAALICEGGTGPFTGALKESYEGIEDDIPVAIVVGTRDYTVGEEFGRRLFADMHDSTEVVLMRQHPARRGDEGISASHYEPYAIDNWCDNGLENITSKRADMVGKLDQVDFNGYWRWLDEMLEYVDNGKKPFYFDPKNMDQSLGSWKDGQPIKALEIYLLSR